MRGERSKEGGKVGLYVLRRGSEHGFLMCYNIKDKRELERWVESETKRSQREESSAAL